MKDIGGQVLVISPHQLAGVFIKHHQARRVGRANALVRIVHPGPGVDVKVIAVNENRAVGRVVRPDAGSLLEVQEPDNIGVERAGFERVRQRSFAALRRGRVGATGRDVRALIAIGTVVAVGHAAGIEADHFATTAHHVHAVTLDRHG